MAPTHAAKAGIRYRYYSGITGHSAIAESVDRIDVYKDRLAIRLRSQKTPGTINLADNNESSLSRVISSSHPLFLIGIVAT
jgi:hypothetical protein